MSEPLVLGTRGSRLALWQAEWVARRLGGEARGVRLEIVRTEGDVRLDVRLQDSQGQGVFTKELERALLDGRVDAAVHSLKDLPTTLPAGLALAAVPERADASDCLLVRTAALADGPVLPLRDGAVVGTSSPRRAALLAHARPDLRVPELFRGNVQTRMKKCVDGEVDAVVLARAGLSRLEVDPAPLIAFDLDVAHWLPAPGQGALGLEVRAGDERVARRLSALGHEPTARSVGAERALLAHLEAGCHAALGAHARPAGEVGLDACAGALATDGTWRIASASGAGRDLTEALAAGIQSGEPAPRPTTSWAAPARPWRVTR